MEEKKLTDEEIVKALEICVKHRENCRFDCDLKICDDDNFLIKIVDLIHRLQSENEGQRKIIEYQDGLPDLVEQQKAEIERLTEEKRLTIEKIKSKPIARLKKDEILWAYQMDCEMYKTRVGELQKQVDELKERYLEESKERFEIEQLYKKNIHSHSIGISVQRTCWEKKLQQAVKDKAKEIIELIKRNGTLGYGGYVIHDSTIEQICKNAGVEVE